MKKTLLSLFLITGLTAGLLTGEDKISLPQAVADGLMRSLTYANSLLETEQAEIEAEQARRSRYFSFRSGANYLYQSETMEIEISGVEIPGFISIPDRKVQAGVHHNFDLKAGIYQPLYTGGRITGSIHLQEIRKALAENQSGLEKVSLSGTIKSVFFDYLITKKSRDSLLNLKEKLEIHLHKVEDLWEEGLAGKIDVLETRARIREIELKMEDIAQILESRRIRFHRLCGHYPEEVKESYREKTGTMEEALKYFRNHHPAYLILDRRKDLLDTQKRLAEARTLPQISGFGEVHYGRPGVDFFKKEWMLYFQGGVTLNWTLFNGNKAEAEKKVLEKKIRQVHNHKERFLRDIRENLEKLFSRKESLKNKISLAEKVIRDAREETEIKAELYREKQLPNRDYLSALESLEQAKVFQKELEYRLEKVSIQINTLIAKEES